MSLHPLSVALSSIETNSLLKQLYPPKNKLKLWNYDGALCHVATYVLTDTNKLIVNRSGMKLSAKIKTAGGCNYPNGVPRMVNSLRLELMDEFGLILTPENMLRISPLYILNGPRNRSTLLQVVLVREDKLGLLWNPERARSLAKRKKDVPSDIEKATPEIINLGSGTVKKVSLNDVMHSKDSWRRCDWTSLTALDSAGVFSSLLSNETVDNKVLIITSQSHPTTPLMNNLVEVLNSTSMSPLRDVAMLPWKPIMWADAEPLQTADGIQRLNREDRL